MLFIIVEVPYQNDCKKVEFYYHDKKNYTFQVSQSDAPGENGKAHHLRVEQKVEEETLKGVYGFNQVIQLKAISKFLSFKKVTCRTSLQNVS